MTYSNAQNMIDDLKAFCRAKKRVLDGRTKSYELVCDQLDEAYLKLCVVSNHIKTAERNGKERPNG